jgi:hypothetical protein
MQIGANLTARQLAPQCKFFDSSQAGGQSGAPTCNCTPTWLCVYAAKTGIELRVGAQHNHHRQPLAGSEQSSMSPLLQVNAPFHPYQRKFQYP